MRSALNPRLLRLQKDGIRQRLQGVPEALFEKTKTFQMRGPPHLLTTKSHVA